MGGEVLPVEGLPGISFNERQRIATSLCMHPDQFMKIMDMREDPYQKVPPGVGNPLGMLKELPIFANYCANGVKLMTDPFQSAFLKPVDGTPTDLSRGFLAGYLGAGPLYCQAMHAVDPFGRLTLEQRQLILKSGTVALDEKIVGYSCRNKDTGWVGLSPVTLYRTAQLERRAPEHALAFLAAAGLHEEKTQQTKTSYYKRFEPMPYTRKANLFTGKRFEGGGGMTELPGLPCTRTINGQNYQGQDLSDQLYISDKTNTFNGTGGFVQEPIHDWNKFFTEWTKNGKTPRRGYDEQSQNYATAFRAFASCPLGYKPWRGGHSGDARAVCGEEKLW
jgi:hypothetical protein